MSSRSATPSNNNKGEWNIHFLHLLPSGSSDGKIDWNGVRGVRIDIMSHSLLLPFFSSVSHHGSLLRSSCRDSLYFIVGNHTMHTQSLAPSCTVHLTFCSYNATPTYTHTHIHTLRLQIGSFSQSWLVVCQLKRNLCMRGFLQVSK